MLSAPKIKRRTRAGSSDTFDRRYRPIEVPEKETTLRDREEMPADVDDHYVWTVIEGDNDTLYVVPGWHHVNRLGYILCEVPWPEIEDELPGYVW